MVSCMSVSQIIEEELWPILLSYIASVCGHLLMQLSMFILSIFSHSVVDLYFY